ncbi:hypothetical protein SBOR_3877 [Sclerotinia borealis F-4128]|uniref:Uncharacterized protein n=1 Tax=Sclerotinia borealis (strain F-4128) TaxID=1432307 RepID=W9CMM6_SCLBF|nr:hypothetical protein SBOR_3877 [Sclerotinia borealis F-4128]
MPPDDKERRVKAGEVETAHHISTLTNTEWSKPEYTLPAPSLQFLFHLECDMETFYPIGDGGHGNRATADDSKDPTSAAPSSPAAATGKPSKTRPLIHPLPPPPPQKPKPPTSTPATISSPTTTTASTCARPEYAPENARYWRDWGTKIDMERQNIGCG